MGICCSEKCFYILGNVLFVPDSCEADQLLDQQCF